MSFFFVGLPAVDLVATDRHTGIMEMIVGYKETTLLCTRICPYPFFEVTSPGAAPDPRLKPGPVFVASGGAKIKEKYTTR